MTIINRWSDHIDSPDNNPIYVGNPSNEVWTTKEEQRIRVGDMTDAHIRNCYNMVMGTRSEYWQNVFRMEMDKRGLKCDGMKIYQLHKYGGEWEDAYDYIIGSYMRKERAEEDKAKAEAKERELKEQSNKCDDCPYLYDAYLTNDELLSYCDKAKLAKNKYDDDIDCQNYTTHWYDVYFRIEEVEVIE